MRQVFIYNYLKRLVTVGRKEYKITPLLNFGFVKASFSYLFLQMQKLQLFA